jgi:hypothetical protein
MLYRRRPQIIRRYPRPASEMGPANFNGSLDSLDNSVKIQDIPLPNKAEDADNSSYSPRKAHNILSIIDFLKDNIHMEEIILLALIFILIQEKVEDEFLLIFLIYILLG